MPPRSGSKLTRAVAVHRIAAFGVRLGLVDCGVRGGVDDNRRFGVSDCAIHRRTISDVKIRTSGENEGNIAGARGVGEAPPKLSRLSGH